MAVAYRKISRSRSSFGTKNVTAVEYLSNVSVPRFYFAEIYYDTGATRTILSYKKSFVGVSVSEEEFHDFFHTRAECFRLGGYNDSFSDSYLCFAEKVRLGFPEHKDERREHYGEIAFDRFYFCVSYDTKILLGTDVRNHIIGG